MKVLSFDIGLRNLGVCLLEKLSTNCKIKYWKDENLLHENNNECVQCKRKAKFNLGNESLCKVHLNQIIKKNPNTKFKIIKNKKIKDMTLQHICVQVINSFNNIINNTLFDDINIILIELQPKINNKMKLISNIIFSKLCEKYINTKTIIKFIRASQKSKISKYYNGPDILLKTKDKYRIRKQQSIIHVEWILNTHYISNKDEYIEYFKNSKKKDDLSDAFCYSFLELNL
jgi:hypothetical protein